MEDRDSLRLIGQNIRRFRVKNKVTQAELGATCNIEESNIARLESGRVNTTVRTLLKIARALNVRLTDLVRGAK